MKLFNYTFTSNTNFRVSVMETRENKSNYSLISNPNKRIPKDLVNKVNPDTQTIYLTERDDAKACSLFAEHLRSQAEVYKHMYEVLLNQANKLTEKEKI